MVPFCYAATSGTYEYNDFNLYSTGGTAYASGALRSNASSLSEFRIAVNVNTNQWWITDGTWTDIPFPTGIYINYSTTTAFLQSAYITCNGNTYSFQIISGSDSSGIFYSQLLPAGPYYPTVNVYLPTAGSSVVVPSTPILSYSDGYIHWGVEGFYTEVYMSDDPVLAGTLVNSGLTGEKMKIREGEDGYYYVRQRYTVNGEYRYTDYSNRVYAEYVSTDQEDNDETWVDKLIDILNGLRNGASTVRQFVGECADLFTSIFDVFPAEIKTVFTAVIVIGLVLGLFLK